MTTSLDKSYRYCAQLTRIRATNFYYGLAMLPPEKRRAMHAIYAFMRCCDDIADDAPLEVRAVQLAAWRRTLDAALSGDCSASPILPAFRDATTRYAIPARYFHELIDGAEMDLRVTRYPTFEDLYRYCYRVAGVVGLVSICVFGYQGEAAPRHAEECGIAFQLTNILRDLREDAERDRVYVPQEDLSQFGYSEADLRAGVRDDRFLKLMRFEAARASDYYERAVPLVSLVSPDSRPCLAAMVGIYRELLQHMERTGFDVYARRVCLSPLRKVVIAWRAWRRYRNAREVEPSRA